VLGAERDILETYVTTGEVRIAFSDILDHGNASLNASAAAHCIGLQNPLAFWHAHDFFFQNMGQLGGANVAYFATVASDLGVDQTTFEGCYNNGTGHGAVTALDSARRQLGIFNRPTLDINGQFVLGAQPFATFSQVIESMLP
jgi:protein-disulfide isomerase